MTAAYRAQRRFLRDLEEIYDDLRFLDALHRARAAYPRWFENPDFRSEIKTELQARSIPFLGT